MDSNILNIRELRKQAVNLEKEAKKRKTEWKL